MTDYELDGQNSTVGRIREFSVEFVQFRCAVSASYPMGTAGRAAGS
jgi:hypothetical protein